MKIEGPLIPATFVERPNRFITLVSIDGDIHRSHLPDPGRLTGLRGRSPGSPSTKELK